MSHKNAKHSRNGGLTPEDRALVMKTLKSFQPVSTGVMTNEQAIQYRAETASKRICMQVRSLFKPGEKAPDEAKLGKYIIELFRSEFADWSKEELLYLLVCLQTNLVMNELGYR